MSKGECPDCQGCLDSQDSQDSQETQAANVDQVLIRIKFEHKLKQSLRHTDKEAHHKRMQSLRKELDHINDTNWQFEPK